MTVRENGRRLELIPGYAQVVFTLKSVTVRQGAQGSTSTAYIIQPLDSIPDDINPFHPSYCVYLIIALPSAFKSSRCTLSNEFSHQDDKWSKFEGF
jgi:hypothetical protein